MEADSLKPVLRLRERLERVAVGGPRAGASGGDLSLWLGANTPW
jgi:hypothetical protein